MKYYQYCYRSFFNYYFNIFLYCSDYIITIMVLGTLGEVIACAAHSLVVEPYCYYLHFTVLDADCLQPYLVRCSSSSPGYDPNISDHIRKIFSLTNSSIRIESVGNLCHNFLLFQYVIVYNSCLKTSSASDILPDFANLILAL